MGRKVKPSSIDGVYIHEVIIKSEDAIRAAGIDPAPALLASIAAYCELLLRWNRKINLTTITDPKEILERHFVESFYGARWMTGETGALCDIGSGAGFPGLALKLLRPGWSVRLFEPNLKKAAFLSEVARELKLSGADVIRERWQDTNLPGSSVDVVTARALGEYESLAPWARRILRPSGLLVLWIGAEEAKKLRALAGWAWETASLQASRERVILAGNPVK